MLLEKGMDCLLLDNSNGVRWTIRNSSGQEGTVPAACFVIPPPNHTAIQAAQRSEPPNLYSVSRGFYKIQVYACICIFHVDILCISMISFFTASNLN